MSDQRQRGFFSSKVHPVWRGIGCLLLILIPVIAFGFADLILNYVLNENPELARNFSGANPNGIDIIYLQLGITLVLSLLLYLVLSILGSLIYTLLGGSEDQEIASRIGSGRRD